MTHCVVWSFFLFSPFSSSLCVPKKRRRKCCKWQAADVEIWHWFNNLESCAHIWSAWHWSGSYFLIPFSLSWVDICHLSTMLNHLKTSKLRQHRNSFGMSHFKKQHTSYLEQHLVFPAGTNSWLCVSYSLLYCVRELILHLTTRVRKMWLRSSTTSSGVRSALGRPRWSTSAPSRISSSCCLKGEESHTHATLH